MLDELQLKAFNTIYNDTYKDILKYVVLHCKNAYDIDDILQNIYLSVYKAIEKNKAINNTYIYGIAKHKISDYYRFKFKRKEEVLVEEQYSGIDESITDINLNAQVEQIMDYLKKKDIITFKIFYLFYMEDYSLNDITNTLDISLSNVKNKLYRTLKELKEVYGEN